eukprot:1450069-Amphidinium_carterae.1
MTPRQLHPFLTADMSPKYQRSCFQRWCFKLVLWRCNVSEWLGSFVLLSNSYEISVDVALDINLGGDCKFQPLEMDTLPLLRHSTITTAPSAFHHNNAVASPTITSCPLHPERDLGHAPTRSAT